MNKLLMEENDRLQKQVSHLVYENGFMKQQLHSVIPSTFTNPLFLLLTLHTQFCVLPCTYGAFLLLPVLHLYLLSLCFDDFI
jgi:hypothetical protein